MANPSYSNTRRLGAAKQHEYSVVSNFQHGYRNREDVTVLPPGVLIEGSQNVLTNTFQRVGVRKGYTLDGAANTDEAPIGGGGTAMGVFDWVTSDGQERNMRAGFLTSAGNDGKLQFRHVKADGTIVWTDLLTGLTSVNFNFITFFDTVTLQTVLLMVNGEANIKVWTGAAVGLTSGANPTGILGSITQSNDDDAPGRASGGKNYVVGDVLTVAGGGGNATVSVTAVTGATGANTLTVSSAGTGYSIGDIFTVDGGSSPAQCRVTALAGSGVSTFTVLNPGQGYSTSTGVTTTTVTGSGTGCRVNITALTTGSTVIDAATVNWGGGGYVVGDEFTINGGALSALCRVTNITGGSATAFTIVNPGVGYSTGTGVATTTSSGAGSGATVDISSLTAGGILAWEFVSDATHGTGYTVDNNRHNLTGGTGTLAYTWINTVKTGSVTKSGTDTWAQSGFTFGPYVGTQTVLINGTAYTYDATDFIGDATTLYGVTPDPSSISNGDLAIQGIYTSFSNAGTETTLPESFNNDFIGTMTGIVFVGSSTQSYIYTSDLGTSTAHAWEIWSPAARFFSVNNPPTSFINQDTQLYVSVGTSQWFLIEISRSVVPPLSTFTFDINPISTSPLQGAQSQALTTNIMNSIAYVSFEPAAHSFGPVQNIYQGPQMVDLSYSIVNLMNDYDFTGGSIKFFRKFVYIAVPQEGKVLIYNMTDPKNQYWEAPQVLPISRFSIIGGELYGHSSNVSETYKLFTGYADRVTSDFAGSPIAANWVFSYENYGSRFSLKRASKMYVEGYISPNATLTARLTYELDGCKTIKTFTLDGDDDQFVCVSAAEGSLGKESLGKVKLGGDKVNSINSLPPKFRWFPTFSNTDFFENSVSFEVIGTDSQTDIVAFGLATSGSTQIPVQKMD